jgi:hypothetical protein
MPQHIERHLAGLRAMTSHAERLYRQGILSSDELEHARTYALEQRFGPLSDAETYIAARESGDFDKFEQIMNDPRSGTAAQREMAARKVAAHKVASTHLETNYQTAADQEAWAKKAHDQVKTYIDTSELGDDPDAALVEANIRLNLGEKVEKPKEVPSWSLPVQRLSDDDPDVKNFRLRDENTPGTRRHGEAYGNDGVKRAADGRIIAKSTLREDADRAPKKQKILNDLTEKPVGSDRGDGMVVDEWGVMTKGEAEDRERFEQSQANDRAAAAEASPPPPSDPGPVTLANPHEA